MRSLAQRKHSIDNLRNAGMLWPRRYVSLEECHRIDLPQLLSAQPPTAEERARGFCVRIVDGVKFILKPKERFPGAWWWFFLCPNPRCRRALTGRGVEYVLLLPDAAAEAWGCLHCLPVTWASRRYKTRSPARAHGTPTHRALVRLARERRRHERAVRRVDRLLAPEVEKIRQKRAEAETVERERNTELARAMIRAVAEQGAVEVQIPQRTPLSVAELRAMVRAARRDRLARVTGG